ncbi:VWA domain-containing protein [Saprospiraceae bacterium]|nr:VWA domain-containing protein [Saprospiraceae bacterium]MDB4163341.1 VWA domain-containing protein [Saprospiraceae bacterium]MDB4824219.1 VWA domain-containing protein [Saprospiraceae bacterium]MDC1305537.1 VWA domain-containing protein [Saprospiraceae bacterium]HCV50727.1 aerotolerance regulator BatA [Saprospirales bacterium]
MNIIHNIEFSSPYWLLLLAIIPLMLLYKYYSKRQEIEPMTFSTLESISGLYSWKEKAIKYLPILRYLALAALMLAMARPQQTLKEEVVKAEGIDIILAMDLSSSMLAKDFDPDRLTVSKEVAAKFVDKRVYDRIGLVVFAGDSFTQTPLTTDHNILKDFLANIECGMLDDGTAIGMGLATATNRLKNSKSKSKVIILLTDGVNNAGYIKPLTAAEIAEEYDMKIYTIGVGTTGAALTPVNRRNDGKFVFGMSKVNIDEKLLSEISKMTGGRYFRATDEAMLNSIYDEIDQLEKTEMEVNVFKRYKDIFRIPLILAFGLLLLEFILRQSILRTLP